MGILFDLNKQFIILGNINAIAYKDIYPKILEHKVWFGYKFDGTYDYLLPNGEEYTVGGPVWFTNLENNKKEYLELTETYEEGKYYRYDNYDAINVDRIKNIPYDYDGVIGVPITALKYLCSDGLLHFDTPMRENTLSLYKIVGEANHGSDNKYDLFMPKINNKVIFKRVLIQSIYKIVGLSRHNDLNMDGGYWIGGSNDATINGKIVYRRILIQRIN